VAEGHADHPFLRELRALQVITPGAPIGGYSLAASRERWALLVISPARA